MVSLNYELCVFINLDTKVVSSGVECYKCNTILLYYKCCVMKHVLVNK